MGRKALWVRCNCVSAGSGGNPGGHHSEQHAGRGRDRARAWRHSQRDAGSGDQPAGSGLWLPARYSLSGNTSRENHPGTYGEHQVRVTRLVQRSSVHFVFLFLSLHKSKYCQHPETKLFNCLYIFVSVLFELSNFSVSSNIIQLVEKATFDVFSSNNYFNTAFKIYI